MKREVNCPYCGKNFPEKECIDESTWYAHICDSCEKRFYITTKNIATDVLSETQR